MARSLDFGGAERQIVELAAGLHAIGWDVKVATFYGGGVFEHRLRDAGIGTICLQKAGRWDVLRFGWRLASLLRRERPDIVHGYLEVGNIPLAVLRPFIRDTCIVWGVRASGMDAMLRNDTYSRMEFGLSVMLSRLADLIICNSRAGHAYHAARGYPSERMIVVPNGVDLEAFRPEPQARAELRSEWGISESQRLIGVIGRLHPMKDHANFLRAAAQVMSRQPGVRFACVGDGPSSYREELIRLAQTLGLGNRIVWAPAREDVWRVYNALDIAVSSSSCGEGFSNTIAEAMATGLPCVVTDVGDSAALVGGLGWICAPNDSEGLAEAISSALSALPVDSIQNRQRIATNYSSGELLRRTVEHLSKLITPLSGPAPAGIELGH